LDGTWNLDTCYVCGNWPAGSISPHEEECPDGSVVCFDNECPPDVGICNGIIGCDDVCHTTGWNGQSITNCSQYDDLPSSGKPDDCGVCGGGNSCSGCCNQFKEACMAAEDCNWGDVENDLIDSITACQGQTPCYEFAVVIDGDEGCEVTTQSPSSNACNIDMSNYDGSPDSVACTAGGRRGGLVRNLEKGGPTTNKGQGIKMGDVVKDMNST
jgi:hypothetical protein